MEKSDFITQIKRLQNNYNKEYGDEALKLMFNEFKHVNHMTFESAINDLIREERYLPIPVRVGQKVALKQERMWVKEKKLEDDKPKEYSQRMRDLLKEFWDGKDLGMDKTPGWTKRITKEMEDTCEKNS